MDNIYENNPMKNKVVKNSSLSHVKLKGSTLKSSESQNLVNDVITILNNEIPDLNNLKNDISLIDNICNLIENHDCKTEIDKKQVATQILIKLFPELNNEKDLGNISKNIDSVIDLSKNINKIGKTSKFFLNTKKWFVKKLG